MCKDFNHCYIHGQSICILTSITHQFFKKETKRDREMFRLFKIDLFQKYTNDVIK